MPLKTLRDEEPSINLTPMVDIVFQLIIFFMVGTRFAEMERKIGVEVPAVQNAEALAAAPEKRVINVYRDGQLSLDNRPVSLEQLTSELSAGRAAHEDLGVLVRGDAEGAFQHVASVLNACRQAGIAELGISVRIASQSGASPEFR